jgi:hypothetical protein
VETRGIDTEFHGRLAAVRRKQDLGGITHGAAFSGCVFLIALVLALIAEDLLNLSVGGRTALFWSLVVLAFGLFLMRIAAPLGRIAGILPGPDDMETARHVGRGIPGINDRLLNTLQLLRGADSRALYSGDLIDAALTDLRGACDGIDFTSTVDASLARRTGRVLAVCMLSGALLFALFPTAFFGAADRLLHFNEAYASPAPFRFIVDPGSRELIKGEKVQVRVRVAGERPDEITIAFRRRGDIEYEERVLRADEGGEFRHQFPPVTETTEYFVHARGVRTDDYTLTVSDRPLIRMLRVTVSPPAYSRLPERQQDDNVGDVAALRGARIRFDVEANKVLRSARLSLSDSVILPLEVAGNRAHGALVLMKERSYHIDLLDSAGTRSIDPVEYALKIIPDAPPTVTLLLPGENLDVTDTTPINLLAKIADDYGFSRARLAYKLVQSKYEAPAQEFTYVPLPVPPAGTLDALLPYRWSMSGLHLVPEDVVSYFVEVFDNDVISGPKSAISEIYSLRLPSMDEVFAQADKGHEASIEGMQDALKQAKEARKEMEELTQSVRASAEKMEWQDKQKAEDLLKKYDDVRGKMDSVKAALDKMVADLSKNRVLSKETMVKYQELQQLMAQLSSPEFAEAMKKLQQAMQQMNPDALRQAMQQFSLSEETFRKSIERTLNLLRRIQIEQKVDEAVRRTEQMIKQQTGVKENTESARAGDKAAMDQIRKEQQEVQEHLDALKAQMEDLQRKMEEFPSEMPLGELEKAKQEMNADSLDAEMEAASRAMEKMQPQEASRSQQRALSSMGKLGDHLQKMQQEMRQNQQRRILNAMRRSMRDLLDLSRREEALKNESETLEPNSRRFRDNEEAQMDVMRDLGTVAEDLAALSQKTFGVTPEMGKSIGDALRSMNDAMRSLAQRNRPGASQQQTEAMGSLNEAAQRVEDSMNAMQQGGGQGMGMAGLMQRLQRLSSQQGGINDASRNLGAMTQAQAAEMARLAGEQGMVRKSLEQLAREAAASGDLKKLMGDLNRAAREMAEVQTDLMSGNLNPETVRKEDRILSRLLDAQRSTRERDFEKKRTSTAGEDILRESPAPLDLTTIQGKERLRRDMQKALEEGYAREYEDLIKRYFEILEQSDSQPR